MCEENKTERTIHDMLCEHCARTLENHHILSDEDLAESMCKGVVWGLEYAKDRIEEETVEDAIIEFIYNLRTEGFTANIDIKKIIGGYK